MTDTFGARFAGLRSARERLQLEQLEQRRAPHADVDAALQQLIQTALSGQRVASVSGSRNEERIVPDVALGPVADAFARHFSVEEHQRRGAWHLPDDVTGIDLGTIHIVHWILQAPRASLTMAAADGAYIRLRDDPWAVALWSLEPLFDHLALPLKLRSGYWLGDRTDDQQRKSWTTIDPLYIALDVDPRPVAAYRLGTGWEEIDTGTVLARRRALVDSWRSIAPGAADRFRIHRLGELADRYYAKASKGVALRRSVLNKNLERTLTLYFGGDWLAFLTYLGEQPHPKEALVTELPDTRLIAASPTRTATVAEQHGIPADEVDRILAALWQQPDSSSPIERRVAVMTDYWHQFDRLHADQHSGQPSLRGLVTDYPWYRYPESVDSPPLSDLSQRLLPDLDAQIAELWGTTMRPRWPDRLLTEPAHHLRMSEAFGPALAIWQTVANDAWELCEGPPDHWDGPPPSLDGLEYRTRDSRRDLREAGFPVDTALFRELEQLGESHGRPKYDRGPMTLTLTITADGVARADQAADDDPHVTFEQLRDVITEHRRRWASTHLAAYLRARWEQPLRDAAHLYHLHAADKSRPPTLKQFAPKAQEVANLWFGGDLAAVYTAIGLRAPARPERAHRLVPPFPDRMSMPLFEQLRGAPFAERPSMREDPEERTIHDQVAYLTRMWLQLLQVWEATGERPPVSSVGKSVFEPVAPLLADEQGVAWNRFCDIVAHLADDQLKSPT